MATTNTNEIYGQIGAAKIFSQDVLANLNKSQSKLTYDANYYQSQIEGTSSKFEAQLLKRKQKLANAANNLLSKVNKLITSANDLLLHLLEMVDISKDAIIEWLAMYLKYNLPALEYSVKAVLLANIKELTSCSIDPTIPDSWRTEGVILNEKEIDPRGILGVSPYSEIGKYNYTVDSENDPLYSLARHTDMNAFIWFVKTSGRFANPNIIGNNITDYFSNVSSSDTLYSIYNKNKGKFNSKENRKFLVGTTFKQTELSQTIFLVEEAHDDYYIIKPVSSTWDSVNWYWNKKNGETKKPVFNLSYSNGYNDLANLPKNNFTFKVLPKPFQVGIGYVTSITNGLNNLGNTINKLESKVVGEDASGLTTGITSSNVTYNNIKPCVARFDEYGKYSKKGKYSIDENLYTVKLVGKKGTSSTDTIGKGNISIYSISPKDKDIICYIWFDSKSHKFYLAKSSEITNTNNPESDSNVITGADAFKVLTECYFGKTVYEFNFDYIWSFKLFDAEVIASNIVNDLMNINYKIHNPFKKNSNLSNTDQIYIDNYIDQLVQNIISEGDSDGEFTGCFYTFDNNDYKALEQNTVNKIQQGIFATDSSNADEITEVYDMMTDYKSSGDVETQVTALKNILNKAETAASSSNSSSNNGGTEDSDSDSSTSSFIDKIIKFLTAEITNAILTPKVLMLIQINQKLMQNDPLSLDKNFKFEIKDILGAVSGIIKAAVREIVESIQKELLRMILERINIIMSTYLKLLSLEYAKKWIDLLKLLINAYKKLMKRLKRRKSKKSSDTDIDNEIAAILAEGNYADILDNIEPNTNNC
jgi:hypothetical protein